MNMSWLNHRRGAGFLLSFAREILGPSLLASLALSLFSFCTLFAWHSSDESLALVPPGIFSGHTRRVKRGLRLRNWRLTRKATSISGRSASQFLQYPPSRFRSACAFRLVHKVKGCNCQNRSPSDRGKSVLKGVSASTCSAPSAQQPHDLDSSLRKVRQGTPSRKYSGLASCCAAHGTYGCGATLKYYCVRQPLPVGWVILLTAIAIISLSIWLSIRLFALP